MEKLDTEQSWNEKENRSGNADLGKGCLGIINSLQFRVRLAAIENLVVARRHLCVCFVRPE